MACDIHMAIEYRSHFENYWKSFAIDVYGDRHYGLFRALGVIGRGDEKIIPISELRGMPPEASYQVDDEENGIQAGAWGGDHSLSWLYVSEFLEALKRASIDVESTEISLTYPVIGRILRDLCAVHGESNVRIVFNFDN